MHHNSCDCQYDVRGFAGAAETDEHELGAVAARRTLRETLEVGEHHAHALLADLARRRLQLVAVPDAQH